MICVYSGVCPLFRICHHYPSPTIYDYINKLTEKIFIYIYKHVTVPNQHRRKRRSNNQESKKKITKITRPNRYLIYLFLMRFSFRCLSVVSPYLSLSHSLSTSHLFLQSVRLRLWPNAKPRNNLNEQLISFDFFYENICNFLRISVDVAGDKASHSPNLVYIRHQWHGRNRGGLFDHICGQ